LGGAAADCVGSRKLHHDCRGRIRGVRAHCLSTSIQSHAAPIGVRASIGSTNLRVRRIAILGSGSWGTALSVHLARIGHDVCLWARDRALADEIAIRRASAVYLPDVTLRERVSVAHSLESAMDG